MVATERNGHLRPHFPNGGHSGAEDACRIGFAPTLNRDDRMYIETLAIFALVHLLAAASPGPNLIIVSSYPSTVSRKAGLLAAIGILLGVFTWSPATALGLGTVLAKYPLLYSVIRRAGAIYLIWLGFRIIRDAIGNRYKDIDAKDVEVQSARSIVFSGYLVNMTNPKTVAY
jgi:threonine efflux protein